MKERRKMTEADLTAINKFCADDVLLWKEIKGKDVGSTLDGYYNLTIHLLIELSKVRLQLQNKGAKK
ncbi:MAG: hypothetical protein O2793_17005 [Proteobacteria bacterium]|nr:hypothetical protein [Pseudomonadota bacterium]